ncbi:ATP-binding cassette domain-containing protein [candidate division WOR-3 bacterium]|uniref:ATP-binding cassette domain-containing protein n=1 Tax=candidate division WOR-3 bacterium TaxID=2052148 RepID=A0A9D5K9R3_UNCW3|nr:ATP-binding cassette domain-containing protein [candidate division WOR-3 bacterium]MBD3365032.1 ATP-binding cassette domain-containing protein [candidate division WOR-3 bacterium]
MIRLEKVSKVYDSGHVVVEALTDIDLTVDEGEYVAIMGSSGSGKSTLMHILGCLDNPTSGSYVLAGYDVSAMEPDALAKVRCSSVGFVFQQFNLLPRLTAAQNVELPLLYSSRPASEREGVVEEMLSKVGLADRGHHRPNELSGGESQRVAIARALANDPAILLADEPTGNLDTTTEEEIMSILDELNSQGRTVIVVTHDETVARHAKRTVHLLDGRIV